MQVKQIRQKPNIQIENLIVLLKPNIQIENFKVLLIYNRYWVKLDIHLILNTPFVLSSTYGVSYLNTYIFFRCCTGKPEKKCQHCDCVGKNLFYFLFHFQSLLSFSLHVYNQQPTWDSRMYYVTSQFSILNCIKLPG